MEEGFVPDYHEHQVQIPLWIEGQPEKSFWTGTRTKGKRQHPIATWRCTRCGYLEQYAR